MYGSSRRKRGIDPKSQSQRDREYLLTHPGEFGDPQLSRARWLGLADKDGLGTDLAPRVLPKGVKVVSAELVPRADGVDLYETVVDSRGQQHVLKYSRPGAAADDPWIRQWASATGTPAPAGPLGRPSEPLQTSPDEGGGKGTETWRNPDAPEFFNADGSPIRTSSEPVNTLAPPVRKIDPITVDLPQVTLPPSYVDAGLADLRQARDALAEGQVRELLASAADAAPVVVPAGVQQALVPAVDDLVGLPAKILDAIPLNDLAQRIAGPDAEVGYAAYSVAILLKTLVKPITKHLLVPVGNTVKVTSVEAAKVVSELGVKMAKDVWDHAAAFARDFSDSVKNGEADFSRFWEVVNRPSARKRARMMAQPYTPVDYAAQDWPAGPQTKYFNRLRTQARSTPGYSDPYSAPPPGYYGSPSYERPSPYYAYGASRRRLHNPYPLVRRRYRRSAYVFSSY